MPGYTITDNKVSGKKKYKLTDETIEVDGHRLFRIRALRSLACGINKGTLGGYVESEYNLSHDGESWVEDKACVYGSARVLGNATVGDDAMVFGGAIVGDNARILGKSRVYGSAMVYGNATVGCNAMVYDKARVHGDATLLDSARVFECASVRCLAYIHGNASVCGKSNIGGNVSVSESATVCGDAWVSGSASIFGHAFVGGNANVSGEVEICNDAHVDDNSCYMSFKNTWSSYRWVTCFKEKDGTVRWVAGCFSGTGKDLVKKAYLDSKLSGDCYKEIVRAANRLFGLVAKG